MTGLLENNDKKLKNNYFSLSVYISTITGENYDLVLIKKVIVKKRKVYRSTCLASKLKPDKVTCA